MAYKKTATVISDDFIIVKQLLNVLRPPGTLASNNDNLLAAIERDYDSAQQIQRMPGNIEQFVIRDPKSRDYNNG